ncbi:DoxX family membrane protein [Modestobacter sp. I12A-02628]|uniref:DoxX family protein n=1 Tax=Goekera deserti TaxID=2497753 RepID=A0A7K3WJ17_9ACTN|nr:DoxX family protein [Goekera deserti]MPQ96599.1 DoxX family membrane protein [Goekera deserti]NDI47089.1 DoxX family membrane protein [Goekera deserti]NEL55513.1 DoxX family protein [Goekera deserti]
MTQTNRLQHAAIGATRIVVGFLFLIHGASTLWGFPSEPASGVVAQFGAWPGWWAAAIQVVGGTLVMLGLGSRVAALICSGSMAYAYFVSHQPAGLTPVENGGETAALFCWAFLLLAAVGPGAFALQSLLPGRRSATAPATRHADAGVRAGAA